MQTFCMYIDIMYRSLKVTTSRQPHAPHSCCPLCEMEVCQSQSRGLLARRNFLTDTAVIPPGRQSRTKFVPHLQSIDTHMPAAGATALLDLALQSNFLLPPFQACHLSVTKKKRKIDEKKSRRTSLKRSPVPSSLRELALPPHFLSQLPSQTCDAHKGINSCK